MKHRFPSFTVTGLAGVLLVIALTAVETRGQGTGDRGQGVNGQELVGEAARRIASEPAVSAELRYRIDAFGHALVGTGNYLQFGAGSEKLVRLDLRMQLGDKTATVQEIRGVDTYWIRRDVPPMAPSLGRVDLKQLRKSAASGGPPNAEQVLPQGDWIMLGGLARLLAGLNENFAFDQPRADELQFNAADGQTVVRLPIWQTTGSWKPEKLAALTGSEKGKAGSLPEQLPDRVELVLGRSEDVLPLFPYRITYWRSMPMDAKAAKSAAAPARELLTLELFNVSRRPIDAREFDYQPGDQDVQNLTQSYVQRLGDERKVR